MIKIEKLTIYSNSKHAQAKDIESKKSEHFILKDITFEVCNKKSIGILGPNGAGKTTLAKVLSNLVELQTGRVSIDGTELDGHNLLISSEIITYVNDLSSDLNLRVHEVLALSRGLYAQDEKLITEIINDLDLENLQERVFSTLSGGERQRVSIACGLYRATKWLILDEPTNFLDPKYIDLLREVICKYSIKHNFIIICHDINFSLSVCDHILGLKKGELLFSNNPSEVIQHNLLNKLYDKNFKIIKDEGGVYIK